jgi:hypothetical protein
MFLSSRIFNTVTCITIATQRVGEHIPAIHEHAATGRLLLGSFAVNRLRQQYRLCFPWGPCKVVIRESNSEAARIRLVKTENPNACATLNCKLCKSAIAL